MDRHNLRMKDKGKNRNKAPSPPNMRLSVADEVEVGAQRGDPAPGLVRERRALPTVGYGGSTWHIGIVEVGV